ncbi:hypothetical protein BC939DRAFT_435327 [Gamsiella multidivaricata]|uniref:uncharacterized protein n=1 Tax=Gamsiella multidivaricata TaxID=101098 RepID=UPI0022209F95|nr:uncharacterized protein BC939DRAFT_435327 [Gamsiella multidivaricata]KAI7832380.1 hypothetical protein BC939DRAFT_435327 [Gamsiella multidivaricata]
MRSKTFKAGELTEVTTVIKNKIRRFVKDYMTKLFKKQPKEERSSTAALVNGTRNSISHVIVLGADGASLPPSSSVLGTKGSNLLSAAAAAAVAAAARKDDLSGVSSSLKTGAEKKSMGYGDVEVDDDDDVKYGEGEEDEGDLDGDEEDDDAGVAAVPSSSVELPL